MAGVRDRSGLIMRPAIFLDRDGVINRNRNDYIKAWSEFEFLPGSLNALQRLASLEWPIVVITNQSAVGQGLISRAQVDEIHRQMLQAISAAGGRINAVLYCPHRADEGCTCRKPHPGLILQVAEHLAIDLPHSFFIGDAENDILAARAAGCQPILVKTGRGVQEWTILRQHQVSGFQVAEDLGEVADWLCQLAATDFGAAE
ncbi:MAG TPA: D-glycero-beta-D-manno-heptose 1,7-bisphosphate 7-phosphatase [Anaerolineae bacterium]|nr:D-glycero-beta-D-manno-heptose 1,7-bisphosphate 7-phosphatase [Anaerolineae bacterium]